MTRYEMIISLLCLVAGYLAVSWTLDRNRSPGQRKPATDGPRPAASESSARHDAPRSDEAARPVPQTAMPWYVVLDVDRSASRAEITAAYRARISQYHPDKVTRMGPEIRALAEKKSAEINTAYATALKEAARGP